MTMVVRLSNPLTSASAARLGLTPVRAYAVNEDLTVADRIGHQLISQGLARVPDGDSGDPTPPTDADPTKVPTSRLVATGAGLAGGGDLTADRTLSVVPNTTIQKIMAAVGGAFIGTRRSLNFIGGPSVSVTAADNSGADRVDITVSALGRRTVLASSYADPTGAANATTGLAAAATAAGAGGVVILDGTFLVDGFSPLAGQTIDAMPAGSGLKLADSSSAASVLDCNGTPNVTVRNVTIDGNRANQSSSGLDGTRGLGLRIRGTHDVRIENVTVEDVIGEGVQIDNVTHVRVADTAVTNCGPTGNRKAVQVLATAGATSDVTLERLRVDSSTSGCGGITCANTASTMSGIRVRDCDVLFGGSTSTDTLGIEVFTDNPGTHPVTDVTITGNAIECSAGSNHAFAVSLSGVLRGIVIANRAKNCQKISFENIGNHISCTGNTSMNSGYISAAGSYSGVVSSDIVISGNAQHGTTFWALQLSGNPSGLTNVVVSGNKFAGPYVDMQGALTDCEITGNQFNLTAAGIQFGSGCTATRVAIKNNKILLSSTTADGIAWSGTAALTDCEIMDNTIRGCRHGVYSNSASTSVVIAGNRITGTTTSGMRIESGSTGFSILNNIVRNNAGWGIIVAGTHAGLALDGNAVSDNASGNISANAITTPIPVGLSTGVATTATAGAPTDAIFATTPAPSTLVVDTTNHRLYVREGTVWKYAALT